VQNQPEAFMTVMNGLVSMLYTGEGAAR
jgi:hypothetical protein